MSQPVSHYELSVRIKLSELSISPIYKLKHKEYVKQYLSLGLFDYKKVLFETCAIEYLFI